jgi:hypothetical protein
VGLGQAVEQFEARVGLGSQYFRRNGAAIAPVQVTDSAGWNATFGMHRADLIEILATTLPRDNPTPVTSEKLVRDIRRATRKQYSAEEKIRIVLDGLRGEAPIAEFCPREGIAESMYYSWSKELLFGLQLEADEGSNLGTMT